MKKFLSLFILISMIVSPAVAGEEFDNAISDTGNTDKLSFYTKPAQIEDELIKSENFSRIKPVYVMEKTPITDELVEQYHQDTTTGAIKLFVRKRGDYKKVSIDDELVTSKFKEKFGTIKILKKQNRMVIEDTFAKNNIDIGKITKIKAKNCYDFSKAQVPVKLKVIKNLTTRNNVLEGDQILFKTIEDLVVNGVNLPKGTKIIGRVETVSESDKMGTPANIIIDNFYVKENPDICFYGNISKTGANRSIWVYPLYQAGNILLYVAGFVFVPIHGGHAKLLTNETYTVFYENP